MRRASWRCCSRRCAIRCLPRGTRACVVARRARDRSQGGADGGLEGDGHRAPGALAGEHGAYEALFDAYGAHEVLTLEEMADAMELFSSPA